MTGESTDNRIDCPEHGVQPMTFVCAHLASCLSNGKSVGYHCSQSDPSNERPDAWCDECEEKRLACGGEWNDESEAFAQITLLCGRWYDQVRRFNIS